MYTGRPWGRYDADMAGPPNLRPRPGLDHAARVRELTVLALRLIDAEGLAGLTMRKLAAEAGLSTMATYRYFPDKQALLTAVVGLVHEEFLAEREKGEPHAEHWLDALIESVVTVLARHHRDITILAQSQVTGPSSAHLNPEALDNFERTLAQLADVGVEGIAAVQLAHLISQGVFMLALACRGEPNSGTSADAQLKTQWESLGDLPAERYPHVRKAAQAFARDSDSTTLLQRGTNLFTSVLRRSSAESTAE